MLFHVKETITFDVFSNDCLKILCNIPLEGLKLLDFLFLALYVSGSFNSLLCLSWNCRDSLTHTYTFTHNCSINTTRQIQFTPPLSFIKIFKNCILVAISTMSFIWCLTGRPTEIFFLQNRCSYVRRIYTKKMNLYLTHSLRKSRFPLNLTDRH